MDWWCLCAVCSIVINILLWVLNAKLTQALKGLLVVIKKIERESFWYRVQRDNYLESYWKVKRELKQLIKNGSK